MCLGSGDPRLQKERQTRSVEPAGGLHRDEDVLQLQTLPCGAPGGAPGAAPGGAPGGAPVELLDGAGGRARSRGAGGFKRSAGAYMEVHVEDDDEGGEEEDGQAPAGPSLTHGRRTSSDSVRY